MALVRFLRDFPTLTLGLFIILLVLLIGPIGQRYVDVENAKVGSVMPDLEPSSDYRLGTDTMGREVLAVLIEGTPHTLRIGLLAGTIGLGIGILFGFMAGYFGGFVDNLLKGSADVLLTVPGLLFLVVLATTIPRGH